MGFFEHYCRFSGVFMDRRIEFAAALILFLSFLPFFLLAALIVRISLGAPVFFTQVRAGQDVRRITIVKLRTMHPQPDDGPPLPDAERTTSATELLRRLRLDELPQLLAVLKGDLALVGPRPLLPETIVAFGPDGLIRCSVRPGITGWSQVSGNTRLNDQEKLQLDLWYVANRSTALDFRILAETASVALIGERRRPDRLAAAMSALPVQPAARRPTS
jgi:lipopolysaccharide/colanic/teichoic acid biosynthesis glycosyltransferase